MPQIRVFPTLKAYQSTHVVPPEMRRIPVIGTVGDSKCEQLFCDLAHEAMRGEQVSQGTCPNRQNGMCFMTNYRYPCLLDVPDDPLWEDIRLSIQRMEVR